MTRLSSTYIFFVSIIALSLAAIDCNSNVTITNARDAEEISSSCIIIQGNLKIDANISDNISLDGLEEVKGDLEYRGKCGYHDWTDCNRTHALLHLNSSTLRAVRGDLDIFRVGSLGSVSLPKLNVINGSVSFYDLWNITSIDLTSLEYSGSISLWAPNLVELKMNGLREFTNDDSQINPYVSFEGTTQLESVDGFFQNPVDQLTKNDTNALSYSIQLDDYRLPKVRHVTFGWKRAFGLVVDAANVGLTLGGPSSESQDLGSIEIRNNLTSFQKGPKMKNLNVEVFTIHHDSNITGDLVLPFDQISAISIYSSQLRSLQLPIQAENWSLTSLRVALTSSENLLNSSSSDTGKKIWHWPKNNLQSVYLYGNLTTELFTDFIQQNTTVSRFEVTDTSGELDCSIFNDINGRFADTFVCYSTSLGRTIETNWLGVLFSMALVLLIL